MKTEKSFTVNIFTPESLFLSEDAESLILPTLDGQRGVLKNHMAAVFALECGVLQMRRGADVTNYAISDGFLEVGGNVANIYVNHCHQESDAARAREEADALRRREKRSVREHRRNEVHLARILAETKRKSR